MKLSGKFISIQRRVPITQLFFGCFEMSNFMLCFKKVTELPWLTRHFMIKFGIWLERTKESHAGMGYSKGKTIVF